MKFSRLWHGLIAAGLLFGGGLVSRAASLPQPGDPAPPLALAQLWQAPAGTTVSWENLKGKTTVLVFWNSANPASTRVMTHLNRVASELTNDPVQFLFVAGESETVLTNFLAMDPVMNYRGSLTERESWWVEPLMQIYQQNKTIFPGWIGRDDQTGWGAEDFAHGRTASGFYVRTTPWCYLVDGKGIIAASGHPFAVTATAVKEVVAGKRPELVLIKLPPPEEFVVQQAIRDAAAEPMPLWEASIQRAKEWQPLAETNKLSFDRGDRVGYVRAGVTPEAFLSALAADWRGIKPLQVEVKAPLPQGRYDFRFFAARDKFFPSIQETLPKVFAVSVRSETKNRDAWVLQSAGAWMRLTRGNPAVPVAIEQATGKITMESATMADLAKALEAQLGQPVLDDTKLAIRFKGTVQWEKSDDEAAAIQKAMPAQIFVQMVKTNLPFEVWTISAP